MLKVNRLTGCSVLPYQLINLSTDLPFLRSQPFNPPFTIIFQCILYPVMKTAGPALPEFNNDRPDDKPSPMNGAFEWFCFFIFFSVNYIVHPAIPGS